MGDRITYAFPSGAPRGSIDRKNSFHPDYTDLADLINDALSDSMSF